MNKKGINVGLFMCENITILDCSRTFKNTKAQLKVLVKKVLVGLGTRGILARKTVTFLFNLFGLRSE